MSIKMPRCRYQISDRAQTSKDPGDACRTEENVMLMLFFVRFFVKAKINLELFGLHLGYIAC